jgi:hypothetical protein|tara:strand:+ start:510 stop:785 length:276 start_codon:yes stop_codon:yes gene_type:complete
MTDFIIDTDIAIPENYTGAPSKYPFEEMRVGESFFVGPNYEDETQKQIGNRIAQARQAYQKRCAKQGDEVAFTQRMWTDAGVAGYRVWRVS